MRSSPIVRLRPLWFSLAPALLFAPSLSFGQQGTLKAWQILEDGIHQKSPDKRIRALHALGSLPGDVRATALVESSLKDEKSDVRASAALTLGEMKSLRSRPKLRALLNDREADVVLASANALYALNDPIASDVFYRVLTGTSKSHDSLTDGARKTLSDPSKIAKLGLEQGIGFIPFAGAGYGALKMLLKDDASPVRGAAALKLAKDPDPNVAQALVDATTDKKATVRAAAVSALAIRNDPLTRSAIEAAMDDPNEAVRYSAAAAYISIVKGRRGTRR